MCCFNLSNVNETVIYQVVGDLWAQIAPSLVARLPDTVPGGHMERNINASHFTEFQINLNRRISGLSLFARTKLLIDEKGRKDG